MTLEIPVDIIKAARECQASREPRDYLNAVHFNKAANRIEATNGYIAFVCAFNLSTLAESLLFRVPRGNLGAKGSFCKIAVNLAGEIEFTYADKTEIIKTKEAKAFPDITPLLPRVDKYETLIEINADYLALAKCIFGANTGVRLSREITPKTNIVLFESPDSSVHAQYLVMPMTPVKPKQTT